MRAAAPLMPDDPREVGRFHLLGRLAGGGMGEVFLGRRDDRPDSLVVVKLVRRDLAHDRHFRERFAAEVAASRQLADLPGTFVARMVDADVLAERPWLAAEFVPGPSVADAAAGGGLPEPEVDRIAVSLAEALSALHSHGLVHGDVTPSNVVLGPDGVRLVDLGLVRTVDEPAVSGLRLGSPGWCAPEVAAGRPASPASDVHGWGCTVAYAASGVSPFGTGAPESLQLRMVTSSPRLDAVPDPLRALVSRALSPEPLLRPTADELDSALRSSRTPVLVGAAAAATTRLGTSLADTQSIVPPTLVEPDPLLPWEDRDATDGVRRGRPRDRRALAGVVAAVVAVAAACALWAVAAPEGDQAPPAATAPSATSSATTAPRASTSPTPTARATPTAAAAATRTSAPAPTKPTSRHKGGKHKGRHGGRG